MNQQKLDTHRVRTKKGRLLFRTLVVVFIVTALFGGTAVTYSLEQTQSLPPTSTLTVQRPRIKKYIFVSPNGNDNWAGTWRRPLRTIQKGVDSAKAGQMVLVRGGTYAEQVIISKSGTRFRPLIITAFPGETPVIDGQYQIPSTDNDSANCNDTVSPPQCFNYEHLVRIEGDHVVFNGFEIRHSLGRGLVVYRYDDIPTGIVITNNNIHDNREAGILLHEANGIIVSNNDISYNSNYATHDRDSSELNWSAGVISVRSENIVYRRNIIHNNWGEGLITANYSGSTNIVIDDNVFYDNYALQLYVHR